MKLYQSIVIIGVSLLSACASQHESKSLNYAANQPEVRAYSVQSVMWQQNAAEYRALCYQAFNLAHLRLDQFLETKEFKGKKLAIVTDIDETILDNSPYSAQLIHDNIDYTPDTWKEWTDKASAKAIPGATQFLNYVKSREVEVFYVSNRYENEVESTIENMKIVGFPFADKEHLLLRQKEGSKIARFNEIELTHTILFYMGDNLSDFSSQFEVPSTEERNESADELQNHFGIDFIVLPNPMYGDWETKGIYQGRYDWSEMQKDSIRKSNIHGY